ncbi:dipeptidase PepE [Chromohalobacter sp. 48-RD10]|uniref:dipeptidase PepE n=1 Tax=Chromohalobacter sp. 48-RD10 TaxID=2994063 RepID=UPI002468FBF8|nr:dipeptidase PepE [Chromohalobacter sp. 48-RD10]
MLNLLLLSSSRADRSGYLEMARSMFATFLAQHAPSIRDVLFIPYAGVGKSNDAYLAQVRLALEGLDLKIDGLHQYNNQEAAIHNASAILVGGGNTFMLAQRLQELKLMAPLRARLLAGLPYMSWSAGTHLVSPSLCTTNDMPIVQPESFGLLELVPFQLNPHFFPGRPEGHNGESREQRLQQYLDLHPHQRVIALPEGTALYRHDDQLTLWGTQAGILFESGSQQALAPYSDLSQLL